MTGRALPLWALLTIAIAGPASAQSADPGKAEESDSTIVVTGKTAPPTMNEVAKQAQEVSRIGRFDIADRALPRFETPVCPTVLGVRADYAKEIERRIRANGERFGTRLGRPGCEANLLIAFVDDSQALLARLASRYPKVFCIIAKPEQEEILRAGEPVRVWSHIRTIDIRWTRAPARVHKCREDIPSQGGKTGMFLPERRDIISSLVLFDKEEVLGMTLTQLADYATMRGLSHTRPVEDNQRMETILALFEGDRMNPPQLTSFDVGYLESLYNSRPDQRAITRFMSVKRRAEQVVAGD